MMEYGLQFYPMFVKMRVKRNKVENCERVGNEMDQNLGSTIQLNPVNKHFIASCQQQVTLPSVLMVYLNPVMILSDMVNNDVKYMWDYKCVGRIVKISSISSTT